MKVCDECVRALALIGPRSFDTATTRRLQSLRGDGSDQCPGRVGPLGAFVLSGAASLLFGTLWPFGTVVALAFIAFTILVEMIKNG